MFYHAKGEYIAVLGGAQDKVVSGAASREIAEKLGFAAITYLE